MFSRRTLLKSGTAVAAFAAIGGTRARAANAPGVTDTEIKIGQTMPYSGPASAQGVIGRTEAAYFKMLNETGGVNGRTISLISLDDGYSPPKTVEQVRRLVEQEEVAFIFGSVGTPTNAAVRAYLNDNKVPQLFIASGASMFGDPQHFPWTIGFVSPDYQSEARIYGRHILDTNPTAKIAVIYQNDGYGKDYLIGVRDGLGVDHAGMIVKEASYEVSEPTVDSQVVTVQAVGADTLIIAATPKFAAQIIRKAYDIGWAPARYLSYPSSSIVSTLAPAGLDKAKGLITASFLKDLTDPRWNDDSDIKDWRGFVAKYMTPLELTNGVAVYGYCDAAVLAHVLKQCGDDLSRENVMRQATNIKGLDLPMGLPGIKINTSSDNYHAVRQLWLARFNGESWELFGELLSD
jgi:branched-chain amino acid transport system substrate-binding protein